MGRVGAVLAPVVTALIGVDGMVGGVLGAAMVTRGVFGAAMTIRGVLGAAKTRGMPGAAMANTRGVPGTAMTTCGMLGDGWLDWMPQSTRSRGVAWLNYLS